MKITGLVLAVMLAVGAISSLGTRAEALSVTCDFGPTTSATKSNGKGKGGAGGGAGQDVTYSVDLALDAACFEGNDTNQIDAGFILFGDPGWTLADKNDDGTSGDGALSFLTGPINRATSGAFKIGNPSLYEDVVLTLKAGNSFAAFLLDGLSSDFLSGLWTSSKDLSHASVYYRGEPGVAPIPLPAGAVLLGSALLGLAAWRRRVRA